MIEELAEDESAARFPNEENEPYEFWGDEETGRGGGEIVEIGWDSRRAHWTGLAW